ncbi:MAG: hypothetical protein IT577_09690 [Verrucomicrobiae bacterium]|nr:hypothetical protein [Verrucomicrobiae bacterium]
MRRRAATLVLSVLLCLALLGGCARQPQLTVVNQSSAPLANLVVSGSGFSVRFGTLGPGERMSLGVSPAGDSSLRFEFDAGGRRYSAAPDCYFESSPLYRVTATIGPDFTVEVDVRIEKY